MTGQQVHRFVEQLWCASGPFFSGVDRPGQSETGIDADEAQRFGLKLS